MRLLTVFVAFTMLQICRAAESVEIKSYMTSALSPDGETFVFEWLDDLWMASSKGGGVLSHGEHDSINIESSHFVKYTQQELNPVTRAMQNAFD